MTAAVATVFGALLTASVTAIGLYLAQSYRRQIQLCMADRRMESYARLWALTEIASPTRTQFGGDPLTETERHELHNKMTSWYYETGNGMLLNSRTREVYLVTKSNLICPIDQLEPRVLGRQLTGSEQERQRQRGAISMRQLSLLRTQIKTDLAIYGRTFHRRLDATDEAFLAYCGVNPREQPWRSSRRRMTNRTDHASDE
jgi:hypothetical protein